jgi:cytochrome o ubiquinol oxidase operon protein cyoD
MLDANHERNLNVKLLVLGFLLSVILTLLAYSVAVRHLFSGWVIIALGSLQALVQLLFFLHLGIESKPRWSLIMFLFMVLVVIIVIGGSLWIMYNLNYHMMTMPEQ